MEDRKITFLTASDSYFKGYFAEKFKTCGENKTTTSIEGCESLAPFFNRLISNGSLNHRAVKNINALIETNLLTPVDAPKKQTRFEIFRERIEDILNSKIIEKIMHMALIQKPVWSSQDMQIIITHALDKNSQFYRVIANCKIDDVTKIEAACNLLVNKPELFTNQQQNAMTEALIVLQQRLRLLDKAAITALIDHIVANKPTAETLQLFNKFLEKRTHTIRLNYQLNNNSEFYITLFDVLQGTKQKESFDSIINALAVDKTEQKKISRDTQFALTAAVNPKNIESMIHEIARSIATCKAANKNELIKHIKEQPSTHNTLQIFKMAAPHLLNNIQNIAVNSIIFDYINGEITKGDLDKKIDIIKTDSATKKYLQETAVFLGVIAEITAHDQNITPNQNQAIIDEYFSNNSLLHQKLRESSINPIMEAIRIIIEEENEKLKEKNLTEKEYQALVTYKITIMRTYMDFHLGLKSEGQFRKSLGDAGKKLREAFSLKASLKASIEAMIHKIERLFDKMLSKTSVNQENKQEAKGTLVNSGLFSTSRKEKRQDISVLSIRLAETVPSLNR